MVRVPWVSEMWCDESPNLWLHLGQQTAEAAETPVAAAIRVSTRIPFKGYVKHTH